MTIELAYNNNYNNNKNKVGSISVGSALCENQLVLHDCETETDKQYDAWTFTANQI